VAYFGLMQKRSRMPRDTNQLAHKVLQIVIGEDVEPLKADDGKDPAAVALGRKGGLKGGKARWRGLSDEERSEVARNAAYARWARVKEGGVSTPSILTVSMSRKTRSRSPKNRGQKS
jgi:hypothetical protein